MKRVLWITFAFLAMATLSWASVVDFGNSYFAIPGGSSQPVTFTLQNLGGVTVTLSPTEGGKVAQDSDGLGINWGHGDNDADIDNSQPETLKLHFSQAVTLNSFSVKDLGDSGWTWFIVWIPWSEQESGQYQLNGVWTTFSDDSNSVTDTFSPTNGPVTIQDISFRAKADDHDTFTYSLKSMDLNVAPVPEPAGIILLGTALSALGLWYRRNRA